MPGATDRARRDLAALIVPLGQALIAQELPILEAHGLSMWGYVVLNGLNDQPTRSQAVLAETIGADKTRLIPVLDQLQRDGLINRERDPDDRRVHVALTPAGDTIRRAVQHDIQHNELQLLERLAPRARQQFLTALTILAQRPEQAFDPAQSG